MHCSFIKRSLHHLRSGSKVHLYIALDALSSYSVIMARKFVLWVKNIQASTRISTLENRAIHESFTAPFVNLTEFVHLDCGVFFKSFVYYSYIYTHETLDMEHTIWEDILYESKGKTSYDVLADSLVKCNLLHPWSLVAGRRLGIDSGRAGIRTLLMQAISRVCRDGWRSVVLSSLWLKPEDRDRTHVYASYLLHKAHSMAWLYPDNVTYATVREDVLRESTVDVQLLPKNITS